MAANYQLRYFIGQAIFFFFFFFFIAHWRSGVRRMGSHHLNDSLLEIIEVMNFNSRVHSSRVI